MNPTPDIPAGQKSSVLQSKTLGKIISPRHQSLEIATEDFMRICNKRQKNQQSMENTCKSKTVLRPYLINFDATGSPCHELTSWDNSSSMSI